MRTLARCGLVLSLLVLAAGVGWAKTGADAAENKEVLRRLAAIRAIPSEADAEGLARSNRVMAESWQYFTQNKDAALPTLRTELARELKRHKPSDLLLLDVGYFLYFSQDSKELARQALYALDSHAPLVSANAEELFYFTHALAVDHDPQVLVFIDRVFLGQAIRVAIPERKLSLDNSLACAFLYGAYGPDAEADLRHSLADPKLRDRVLEILIWVGTPASDEAVRGLLEASPGYDTFTRATTFLMRMGGPLGRDIMLATNPNALDERTQDFYHKLRPSFEAASFASLSKNFSVFGAAETPSKEELETELSTLYENFGTFGQINPNGFLNAPLARDDLVNRLTAIRTRMFHRISGEGLTDAEIAGAVINTLRYRDF